MLSYGTFRSVPEGFVAAISGGCERATTNENPASCVSVLELYIQSMSDGCEMCLEHTVRELQRYDGC
jgi:hypothetical protein